MITDRYKKINSESFRNKQLQDIKYYSKMGKKKKSGDIMPEITPVAHIYTLFPTKFGIPRQSGLVDTISKIVFTPPFRSPDAIRGIEGYSHLWLIWEFSDNKEKSASLTVRPPRLGGNTRMGVFATRSPFRPNNLGLSCVEIERTDYDCTEAPVIYVKGADILDGTPIFDIKPYLPYTDAHPDAESGFSGDVFSDCLEVIIPEDIINEAKPSDIPVIKEILSQDPRPHYQNDPERIYSFEFSRYRIKFRVSESILTVVQINSL